MVYDVSTKQRVFKSIFRDATSTITRLLYVSDFEDDLEIDEHNEDDYNRFKDDEIVNDEYDNGNPNNSK